MEPDKIIFYDHPALRQPDLVAAFLGWPDANQVSNGTVSYIVDKLPAIKLAEMKSDDYYDFAPYAQQLISRCDQEGSLLGVDAEGADQIIKDIENFLRNQRPDE